MSNVVAFPVERRKASVLSRDAILRHCRFAAWHAGCNHVQREVVQRACEILIETGCEPWSVILAAKDVGEQLVSNSALRAGAAE